MEDDETEEPEASMPPATESAPSGDSLNDRTLILLVALAVAIAVGWVTVKDKLMRMSAQGGYQAIVRMVVLAGADANGADESGRTALSRAALNDDAETARILLSAGANVDARDVSGESPLVSAISAGHHDLVALLLDSGADVKARDLEGWTPLMWAALYDRPIVWACERRNWPCQAWRRRLPDQSTMSRRLRRCEVLVRMRELIEVMHQHRQSSSILLVDGKALEVGEHTQDPEARIGRGVSRIAKGYKLHALIDDQRRILAWRVYPLNAGESVVAQELLRDAAARIRPGTLLLADAAYDTNRLHLRAAVHGVQLIAPRKQRDRPVDTSRKQHRNRLISVAVLEGRGSRKRHRWFARRRTTIERFFGNLVSVGGGLGHLPAWVRRLHRCRVWVAAKLVIHTARRANA